MMSTGTDIFDEIRNPGNFKLSFSSSMSNVDKACLRINDFLKSMDINIDPHLFAINLVLREGLTNAVRHGNQNNSNKQVFLELDVSVPHLLLMKIEDQGDGFDWQEISKITVSEESLDHGRGMIIMKKYFTTCCFNDKGNVLYLEKRLSR